VLNINDLLSLNPKLGNFKYIPPKFEKYNVNKAFVQDMWKHYNVPIEYIFMIAMESWHQCKEN
jgi:hypothetical protein